MKITVSNLGRQAIHVDDNQYLMNRRSADCYTRQLEHDEKRLPEARTITTTWNTDLNKPLTVTEPGRITTYTYDSAGRFASEKQETAP